jgi:hypothetical protein
VTPFLLRGCDWVINRIHISGLATAPTIPLHDRIQFFDVANIWLVFVKLLLCWSMFESEWMPTTFMASFCRKVNYFILSEPVEKLYLQVPATDIVNEIIRIKFTVLNHIHSPLDFIPAISLKKRFQGHLLDEICNRSPDHKNWTRSLSPLHTTRE